MKKFNKLLSILLVLCMILAMFPLGVFAVSASTVTTDLDQKTFVVNQQTSFTVTTHGNDDAGTYVLGTFTVQKDGQDIEIEDVAILEYQDSESLDWHEFYGDFGPAGTGFPMGDGDTTSTFRVTFKEAGSYSVKIAMVKAVGRAELCSTTANITVNEEATVETVDIPVSVTGDGVVKVNDTEVVGNSVTVNKGEEVTVDVIPETDDVYIKSLVVAGTEITVEHGKPYNGKATFTGNEGGIDVTFATEYTVKVTPYDTEAGSVTLNEESTDSVTVDKGTEVTVTVEPADGYQISSVNIGGVDMTVSDPAKYSTTITVNAGIDIAVTFVRVYTVTVTYNENGSVTVDNALVTSGGTVSVKEGTDEVTLVATPNANYRVASVVVNGTEQTFDEHEYVYTQKFAMSQNYTVTVTFAESTYEITVEDYENGTVVVQDAVVNHGGSTTVTITPDAANGYEIGSVKVNGTDMTSQVDADGNLVLKNIKKTQVISVTFTLRSYAVSVAVSDPENGTIDVDKTTVEHGSSAIVTIIPYDGYEINKVTVNGVEIDLDILVYNETEAKYTLTLTVTGATSVVAEFAHTQVVDSSEIKMDNTYLVRQDGDLYVFSNGATVKISINSNNTDKKGIRLATITIKQNGQPKYQTTKIDGEEIGGTNVTSIEFKNDIEIDGKTYVIQLWENNGWHNVDQYFNIVIDDDECNATLTPDAANDYGYYNADFKVGVSVADPGDYSGIASVKYWIISDGAITKEKTDLYTYETEIKSSWDGEILVDAESNNSDNVVVYVEVTDRAGNIETFNTGTLKVNCTAPTLDSVNVISETNKDEAADGYYTSRTIELTITDRASTFDQEAATNGIVITAKDVNGGDISIVKSNMISWVNNGNTHVATINFTNGANYSWSISYTNLADMNLDMTDVVETGDNIYDFTVDATAPTAKISYKTNVWDKLLETLTFGIWSNESMTVTAELNVEAVSPIYDITYYKSNSTTALTETELEALKDSFTSVPVTVSSDELFVVYARIVDYAGNVTYISTDGMIYDNTNSVITITPAAANDNGFHKGDVKVQIDVTEIVADGAAYSGIKTIDYQVIKDGNTNRPTQSGNLYTFDAGNSKDDDYPKYADLKSTWSTDELEDKCITVYAGQNNSDNIKVVVTVVDNAGNTYTEESSLAINVDEIKADIAFEDSAYQVVDGNGYFDTEARVATITVTDRSTSFDETAATDGIVINAVDASGNPVADAYTISDWESDGNKHTATIKFQADANYTWSFSYTNKADNSLDVSKNLSTGNSVTPFSFTVDDTDPTASVTIDTNVWNKLLEVLTFGIYSNDSITVVADAKDDTSPVVIQYYKTDRTTAMSSEELDKVKFVDFKNYTESNEQQESVTVESDEWFVVYFKVSDFAGNYIYVNSDGAIVDKTESNIELTPEKPKANGFYGSDYKTVEVDVKVTDAAPYSGIKTVDYWIIKDHNEQEPTQFENLFTFDNTSPNHSDLVNEKSFTIPVDTQLNNSCDVVVYVKVVDNAGNEHTDSVALDIDITAPAIAVSYDNNNARNDEYFNANRTATIVITERTHHFDAKAATAGITITAVDAYGKEVEIDPAVMISDWDTKEGATADEATHTATISYTADANYTFSISYTDQAGNVNSEVNTGSSVAPNQFTVDKVAPFGTITGESEEGRTTTWNTLVSKLTFGFWSGTKITITGTSDDVTSPIESVQYYKASEPTALTVEDLAKVTTWTDFNGLVAVPNEQLTVYLKIMDKAGNVTYISTDGMILDDTAPREESIAPEITVTPEQPINGLYNGDVKVSIEVTDPAVGDTFAGLKSVTYRVLNMGKETQSDTLYSFNSENPVKNELRQTWTDEIIVDSELNNSNNVVIEIYAEDNAGNTSMDSVSIKIDITDPQIHISYNNNNPDSGSYYSNDRTATITVTERNFNADDVNVTITNTDGVIPTISGWTKHEGTGNLDNTTYTATISYTADGDYTFDIAYTDLAANTCPGETYVAGTTNPTEFTIDKTAPTVSVTYDNNNAANEKYFNAVRTATVTIIEHNFDVSRVNITLNAGRGGVVPNVAWTNNGDRHIATISYSVDGDYTFDISMKDMAGNANSGVNYGNSVAGQDFVIDTTFEDMISYSGVENGKAYGYSSDVIPNIEIADINLDQYTVTLIGVQKDKTIDLTDEVNALLRAGAETITGVFDVFKTTQDLDGIYTLTLTAQDKAGNQDSETVIFTVNRFGSVYVYDEYLLELIADGGAYVLSVTDDLVITEYNADKLLSGSLVIEITCDGKPLENVIYTVTPEINDTVAVGNSGWYQYKYTISKDNFTSDGIYKISVSTEDATGNKPENNNYEDMGITFRVDSTQAEITSITGLEKNIVNATELTVKYTVFDTMGIQSIKIYVNGKLVDEISDFSADLNNYNGSFVLSEQSSAQSVRIVVEDLSGNITDTDSEDFSSAYEFNKSVTVSTNIFVRWYANKGLFWGSIIGVVVVICGIWFIIIIAKRKKKEEATAK